MTPLCVSQSINANEQLSEFLRSRQGKEAWRLGCRVGYAIRLQLNKKESETVMSMESREAEEAAKPQWQPLPAMDRRVVGVLIEKAKTTSDAYPLSLSAIRTGSNQKSNRDPTMQLSEEDVEESLERLRQLGAVTCVQGSGRVDKFRHEMYRWLGVDKVELAVMAELLLRGAQTEGELRGRAARMDPIADLAALRPVLESLKAKGLVLPLNRPGRGHVVTHALYQPQELEKLRTRYSQADDTADSEADTGREIQPTSMRPPASRSTPPASSEPLHAELQTVRNQVEQLRADVDELRASHDDVAEELRRLKESLGS